MSKVKIITRSILRQRMNSVIIIISLAIGIACFNMILLFINRELQTDEFQKDTDQIYSLKCDDPWIPGLKMYHCRLGSAEYMKENIAQVEDFCRINAAGAQKIIIGNEEYFDRPQIISASANFFSFFSYNLLTKNPETLLESTGNIVISDELARKYFGSEEPLGKIITLVNRDKVEPMVVTGIFEKPAANTQIGFDMVRLIGETDSRCYLKLTANANVNELEILFAERKETIPVINTGTPGTYYLSSLKDTYFDTTRGASFEVSRDKGDLFIALIIGLMIIGVAAFNYLGLLTNSLIRKNKEINIRRVNGGSKLSIISGIMMENLIIIGVSFILSLLLMQEMIPFFNKLTGSNITERLLLQREQLILLPGIVVFLLIITLLFILHRIQAEINPDILKTGHNQKFNRFNLPVFNIFQLASSVVLIICSIIIIRQMNFISEKSIGLDKKVVEVKLPGQYADKAAVFKEELMKNAAIEKVSVVSTSPVLEHFLVLLKYNTDGVEKEYSPAGFTGDENYLTTMGIEVIDGSGFSENIPGNQNKCVVNESFAKLFSGQDLLGKEMPGMEKMTVIGIVKDFNYSSLKSVVEPAFIAYASNGSHLMVKANGNNYAKANEIIEQVWHKLIPDYPVSTESIGDRYEWFHRENKNYIRLIGSCSLISLFLSMIGLFAVSYQTSQYRTKEIGIRKINGARNNDILAILNKDFIKWLAIAFVIAFPVSWFAMNGWLKNFAYKTDFSWWVFALAGIITIAISLLTVSWQSIRAATRNPVEALRYE